MPLAQVLLAWPLFTVACSYVSYRLEAIVVWHMEDYFASNFGASFSNNSCLEFGWYGIWKDRRSHWHTHTCGKIIEVHHDMMCVRKEPPLVFVFLVGCDNFR